MTRFLLDTNMLLGFIREAPWALRARTAYDLADQQTIIFHIHRLPWRNTRAGGKERVGQQETGSA